MRSIQLISPAKVNLFLKITGRRPDGFHELASLFQTIDLFDVLTFELAENYRLHCSSKSLPTDRSNLIWKAVDLYRQNSGLKFHVHVDLEKHIPIEAGLGGGSSNAATALWAVNSMLGSPVSERELVEWAGEIGSDTAFFLSQGTAYCTGRGEQVQALDPLAPAEIQIFKPNYGLSTAAVYSRVNIAELSACCPKGALQGFIAGQPCYFNDLEEAAFSVKPELIQFKRNIESLGFEKVLLSGSGSAFIAFGNSTTEQSFPDCFNHKAQFINRSFGQWYAMPNSISSLS